MLCCRSFVCHLVTANTDCQPRVSSTEVSERCRHPVREDRSWRSVRWVISVLLIGIFCGAQFLLEWFQLMLTNSSNWCS